MSFRGATAGLALVGLAATSVPALAMTGIGCPDLPAYYRALGTIENGEGSCGMSMAEANRILSRPNPEAASVDQPAAPVHRKHHRRKVAPPM